MKKKYLIIDAYINNACKKVHSRHIKKEIRDELFSHLMEHYERQIALGKSDEEAQKFAVSCMGDSETISKTFEKLYKGTEKFIQSISIDIAIGIMFMLVIPIIEFNGYYAEYSLWGFWLIAWSLFSLKKVNKYFQNSLTIHFIGYGIYIFSEIIYDYFALPINFMTVVSIITGIIHCAAFILIILGIWNTDKKFESQASSKISYIIQIILMIITQSIVITSTFFESVSGYLFLLAAAVTGVYPVIKIYLSYDVFEKLDWNIPKKQKELGKAISITFVILLIVTLSTGWIVSNRPAKAVEYTTQDITTEVNVDEIRENMISLGLPQKFAYELPDSEILNYKNAEFMEIDTGEYSYRNELTYYAYAFYLPETDTKLQRARILFVISGFEAYNKLDREGIYMDNRYIFDNSEFKYDLEEYDGSFMQILCDIEEKTKKVVPFYQRDLKSIEDLEHPIGCDYNYPKNSENHRIYAAQTVVTVTNSKYITAGYAYRYQNLSLLYSNTVGEQYEDDSICDSIYGVFVNPLYVEPKENEDDYSALQNIINQFSDNSEMDLTELESVMEEELGYDIDAELLEDIVNQVTNEVANP